MLLYLKEYDRCFLLLLIAEAPFSIITVSVLHFNFSHLGKNSQTFLHYLVRMKFEQMSDAVIHRQIHKCGKFRHLAFIGLK
jgi:hypothetical protein